jgi:hypothetical protein
MNGAEQKVGVSRWWTWGEAIESFEDLRREVACG